MEELKIYLELVRELGDPFTLFERIEWPDEPPVPTGDSPGPRRLPRRAAGSRPTG